MNEFRTIGEAIDHHANLGPECQVVVSTQHLPISYGELCDYVNTLRTDLRRAGFDPNARIVVALQNGPQAALAVAAISCSAVAVPLDLKLAPPEVDRLLTLLSPAGIVLLRGSHSAARTLAERQSLPIIEAVIPQGRKLGLRLLVPQVQPTAHSDKTTSDTPAFILQTSGTTGQPKLIPYTHRNMLAAAARVQAWFGLTPSDRCLCVSPIYYSHGLKMTVFTPIITGGSFAFPANTSQLDVAEWFDALAPTWYSAGPTLHRYVLDKTRSMHQARSFHSLRFAVSGGAPLPPDVHKGLEATLNVPVLEHYGSSEAAQISTNLPPPGPAKPGTCGILHGDVAIIVGKDGHSLPSGEKGEILVRGPTVMSGYLDAPELNRAAFVGEWFRTGDIGSLDKDGFLALHGREKDLINRGGEKIAPTEIDNALMRHPAVAEAAAYAVPHPRLGDDVAAVVVLHPGSTLTPMELREFLSTQLAWFKIPRRIVFHDQLPKGLTGKVQRRRLGEITMSSERLPECRLRAEMLEAWSTILRRTDLTIDDDFFESGGDSLLATELVLDIERRIGKTIPDSLLFEASTVRRLVEILLQSPELRAKAVYQVTSPGENPPLLFFHGDWTNGGFYVGELARSLGAEQPLIAVAPQGIDGEKLPRSVEDMAAERLPQILKFQPRGPYRLGGHCVGGMVALETARLLVASGHKVEVVAMIDPIWTAAGHPWPRLQPSSGAADTAQNTGSQSRPVPRKAPTPESWQQYGEVLAAYVPKPLSVPITVFSSDFDGRAWHRLSADFALFELPGGHYDWVTAHSDRFAAHLRARLQRVS